MLYQTTFFEFKFIKPSSFTKPSATTTGTTNSTTATKISKAFKFKSATKPSPTRTTNQGPEMLTNLVVLGLFTQTVAAQSSSVNYTIGPVSNLFLLFLLFVPISFLLVLFLACFYGRSCGYFLFHFTGYRYRLFPCFKEPCDDENSPPTKKKDTKPERPKPYRLFDSCNCCKISNWGINLLVVFKY